MTPFFQLKNFGGLLAAAVFLFASGAANPANSRSSGSASNNELTTKKEDLGELRRRIDLLKKELSAGETSRNEASDLLRENDKSISELQREIYDLSTARESHQERLIALSAQARQAEGQLSQQQTLLDRLLVQKYISGIPGPLDLLLSGQAPSQTARDMTYLGVIAQARHNIVKETASLIEEKRRLRDEIQEQTDSIAANEAEQKLKQEKMLVQRKERQKTLADISSRLIAQRKEISTLRRDEKRLSQLISRIADILAKKAKAAKKAKPPRKQRPSKPSSPPDEVRYTDSGSFAGLRGKLSLPSQGTVKQKFGAPQEGGNRAKGLFISSPASSEVRSIAAGQVVFADWLRGFGNLMVIDHDDGYLSIYGYNDAILKRVGDEVRTNETIARVGNSGGRAETGLYFELRRQGEAIDPAPWLRR